MVLPSSLFAVVTGLLLTTPCLISATPLPSEQITAKARIIPLANRHAVARQAATYESVECAKKEVERMRKRARMLSEVMERSNIRVNNFISKRHSAPSLEPYDIGKLRRAVMTKRQGSTTKPLTNFNDTKIIGEFSIGTPSQTSTFQIDTGSSDLLVPTSDCKACVGPFFEPRKSNTFANLDRPFNTSFGNGAKASGYLASDTVAFGDLSVENQIFAIITEATDNFDKPNSGLIGFGFQTLAQSHAVPWFFNLANEGKLASNVASFYMTRQEASGSEACIGCIDSTKFTGEPEYFPLFPGNASQQFWSIMTRGMTYNNKPVLDEPLLGLFDTGGPWSVVPSNLAKALHSHIPGAEYDPDAGGYVFPCDNASSFAPIGWLFEHSSTVFNIRPSQLNLGEGKNSKGSNRCLSPIFPSDEFNIALIGDTFLNSWYSIFDYGNMRVGFAKAV